MNLTTLQRWAEVYAAKLGVSDPIVVRISRDCPGGPKWLAHIHSFGIGATKRGTICVRQLRSPHAEWAQLTGQRGWRWLIAHEVCHLKVRDHNSPYFHRWMARLGFIKEKKLAQVAGLIRHRHTWSGPMLRFSGGVRRQCRICKQDQEGKVIWGKITKKP